jgi:hypothetical protein
MSATKTTAKAKATKPKADGKLSALDAAAKVLASAGEPMNCKEMIEAMAAKGVVRPESRNARSNFVFGDST